MKGNKKMVVVTSVLVAALMLIGGASLLYAHFGHQGGPGSRSADERFAWISERLSKRLDLNDAQRQEVQSIVKELGEKRNELHGLRSKGREELLTILRAENVDQNRVKQLVAEHKQVIGDLITSATDRLTDFAATLSPEQRARLAEAIEEHSACFHGHSR
jgi:Spy/CpxP family protein refolding chaperone